MFLVHLAPVSDAEQVVTTIIQTLGISQAGNQPLLVLLKSALKDKQRLLLLDNFEQVVQAAVVVAELLAACPTLKVLVTSRVVLHVQAEREYTVPPLSLPNLKRLPDLVAISQYEAVALFIGRAQAVKPDFQVTNASAPAVAAICVHLDGLPLAIELAAARIKLLPPQALLARLSQRLSVLTGGSRDVPVRQQSLRNTIAWSYDLLSAAEQQLFRRLATFVGGCTLEAVETVYAALEGADGVGSVLDDAGSLLDKSLVQQTEQEGEEPRLVMLETVREYGQECLRESREEESSHRAHAEYYLTLAEEAEPHLHEAQLFVWLKRLNREQENFRAALRWLIEHKEAEHALRLSGALNWYWYMRGYLGESLSWLQAALQLSNTEDRTVARAKVLRGGRYAHLISRELSASARPAGGKHRSPQGIGGHTRTGICDHVSRGSVRGSGRLPNGSLLDGRECRPLSSGGRQMDAGRCITRFGTGRMGTRHCPASARTLGRKLGARTGTSTSMRCEMGPVERLETIWTREEKVTE